MKEFHLHLVSDSTGETVSSVSRAALAQFEGVEAEEHVWSMIRTKGQLEKIIEHIREEPGIVFFTIADEGMAEMLKTKCLEIGVPVVPVINRALRELSFYLGMQPSHVQGKQHEMDDDYFERVDIINFALAHDDGQATWELEEADIVIVGVSRTSKSPTTMYLAYRGYKAANVPYVPGCDLPGDISQLKNPIVVGLTISAERLVQIRKSRLASLDHAENTNYTEIETIKQEIDEASRLFRKNKWPIIDVTRRSVEETAAIIIQKYSDKREKAR
ncbi:MAG: phosphoenolpyruvate synthase regulatory protein [Alphaproteobacteria bacterium CG11_big_fil_rev_8_21_14_0_20_44_7]|nr:MAG: phosphoenolpyruvate synthase regulatory protein [Alphaproteobacteria bacterium CG11_big_fil_rev_8_21_14_0_20_44_7]